MEVDNGRIVTATSLSRKPPIFEIKDFLSVSECDSLIELAQKSGLEESVTLDDNEGQLSMKEFEDLNLNKTALGFIRLINEIKAEDPSTKGRFSEQTFLGDEKHPLLSRLRQRLSVLTGLPRELIDSSEDLQVVRYKPGGHYNCHLDSEEIPRVMNKCCHLPEAGDPFKGLCQLCRYMTVLYFLNDVEEGGETAFPLADNETLSREEWTEDAEGLCNLARNCKKSRVVVKPEKGKAILWYNHHRRKESGWMGQIDYRSFHGGCNVWKGQKWIANNWINVSPIRDEDLRLWAKLRSDDRHKMQGEFFVDENSTGPEKEEIDIQNDVSQERVFGVNDEFRNKVSKKSINAANIHDSIVGKQSPQTLDHSEL
eukprot:gene4253-20446_t